MKKENFKITYKALIETHDGKFKNESFFKLYEATKYIVKNIKEVKRYKIVQKISVLIEEREIGKIKW